MWNISTRKWIYEITIYIIDITIIKTIHCLWTINMAVDDNLRFTKGRYAVLNTCIKFYNVFLSVIMYVIFISIIQIGFFVFYFWKHCVVEIYCKSQTSWFFWGSFFTATFHDYCVHLQMCTKISLKNKSRCNCIILTINMSCDIHCTFLYFTSIRNLFLLIQYVSKLLQWNFQLSVN